MATTTYAHNIEFKSSFAEELFTLCSNLFEQTATYSSCATNKKVEFFVFAQKETVVKHVDGFAQLATVNNKRKVHFLSTHSCCIDADTIATEHTE